MQQQGKLVNTTFYGGREHTTTVFPLFFLESGYSPVADPEEGAAGPGPPVFLDQTEVRRAEKIFLGDRSTTPPPPTPTFISRAGPGTAFYKNLAPVKSPAFNKLRGYMNKRHKV